MHSIIFNILSISRISRCFVFVLCCAESLKKRTGKKNIVHTIKFKFSIFHHRKVRWASTREFPRSGRVFSCHKRWESSRLQPSFLEISLFTQWWQLDFDYLIFRWLKCSEKKGQIGNFFKYKIFCRDQIIQNARFFSRKDSLSSINNFQSNYIIVVFRKNTEKDIKKNLEQFPKCCKFSGFSLTTTRKLRENENEERKKKFTHESCLVRHNWKYENKNKLFFHLRYRREEREFYCF